MGQRKIGELPKLANLRKLEYQNFGSYIKY